MNIEHQHRPMSLAKHKKNLKTCRCQSSLKKCKQSLVIRCEHLINSNHWKEEIHLILMSQGSTSCGGHMFCTTMYPTMWTYVPTISSTMSHNTSPLYYVIPSMSLSMSYLYDLLDSIEHQEILCRYGKHNHFNFTDVNEFINHQLIQFYMLNNKRQVSFSIIDVLSASTAPISERSHAHVFISTNGRSP
jgi:hypothetical protein